MKVERGVLVALAAFGTTMAALASQSGPASQADVVSQALAADPGILSAQQHVREMRSHVLEVLGQRRFQVSLVGTLSGSSGEVAEPPSYQSFGTVEAGLNVPIPNFGRTDALVDQANANLAAAQAQLARARLDVEFRTGQAYFELLRAQEAVSIAQENLDQSSRQADDARKRIDAGDLPPADLLKAEVPVAQNKAALGRAKNALRAARQTLNDLLQRDLNAATAVAPLADAPEANVSARDAVAFALAHSPDVLEARANLDAAQANARFVRRGRDPDLSLQLTHARTNDPTAYSELTTLSLSVTLPLADAGIGRQQSRQADLQTQQSEAALKQAVQRTRLAVEQAVLDVDGDAANLEANGAIEEIARQSLEKARQSYAAGLTTTRDVLDAQLVYSQARVETNSARYDLAIARAHLKQLVGGTPP